MRRIQIVLDTNVLIAGLRSSRGASFLLLSQIGTSKLFDINLSVPLVLEYEDVAKRTGLLPELSPSDIDTVMDYLCAVARRHDIFFLWRPLLRDPKDDMILELAVEGACDFIVTFNGRDFNEAAQFGIRLATPQEFLKIIGVLS